MKPTKVSYAVAVRKDETRQARSKYIHVQPGSSEVAKLDKKERALKLARLLIAETEDSQIHLIDGVFGDVRDLAGAFKQLGHGIEARPDGTCLIHLRR